MKTFLLISGGLLLLALVIVVVVFFYLSFQIKTTQSNLPSTTTTTTASVETGIEAEREATPAVHLRDLPINDSQQKVLETVGVEVDTFVITPAMQPARQKNLAPIEYKILSRETRQPH
jgi:hypothetical protein